MIGSVQRCDVVSAPRSAPVVPISAPQTGWRDPRILLWPGSDGGDQRSIVGLLNRAGDLVIDGCDVGLSQAGSR